MTWGRGSHVTRSLYLVIHHIHYIRSYSTSDICSTESDYRYIWILYGDPLLSLDRSLHDSSSDGRANPRDARHQYRYRTHPRYLTRWTSRRSSMVTCMVGDCEELEEVDVLDNYLVLFSCKSIAYRSKKSVCIWFFFVTEYTKNSSVSHGML